MAHKLPKPKTGGTPKRITTVNPPGGPFTPGAKEATRPDRTKQRGRSLRKGNL